MFMASRKEPGLRRNKRKKELQQQRNCFLLINKKLQLSGASPDNRFLLASLSPARFAVWYFVVDNATLRSSQLLAEQWKIKLKWALDWLWLVSSLFYSLFTCLCTMRIWKKGREVKSYRWILYWDDSIVALCCGCVFFFFGGSYRRMGSDLR